MNDYPSIDILYARRADVEQWTFANLAAPYWRLYWNETPGWSMHFAGEDVALTHEHFWLIPPETPFSTQVHDKATQYYLHFMVEGSYRKTRHGFYAQTVQTWATATLKDVLDHTLIPETGEAMRHWELMQLQAVIAYGLRCIPVHVMQGDKVSEKIQYAMTLMEQSVAQGEGLLGNEEVADQLEMNVNAYIRRFKAESGKTPKQWLMGQRIAYACRLLHHSDASIEEIAEQTGFYDRYHFSREFMKQRHMSPVRYRRQLIVA